MSSKQQKQWQLREPIPPEAHETLLSYPELQRELLWHRNVRTADEAERFLHPSYERDLHDPFLILNMERAVDRILYAIARNEAIVVYADYDCDGIPGATVLHDFFKKIAYQNFRVYIPHRYKDGYGLNNGAIEQFNNDGVRLIITVDNGITDVEQVALAQVLGIDVIVTDHHLPQEKIPEAYAVVNSKQKGDTYPFNLLCGAGVAFKLVQALIARGNFNVPTGWEKWLLDVVGIATVADMVPLVGENRVLAYYGLKVLQKTPRPGLARLFANTRIKREHICEDDIGFSIAPTVNAASRLGVPSDAFTMLAGDALQGTTMADHLHAQNDLRKWAVKQMVLEAHQMMANREHAPVIVIGKQEWKPGLLGLVASALTEHYARPVFVWGKEGSLEIKGSCRSDGSVNIVDLMLATGDGIFLDKGGHELAGGFSCDDEQIKGLETALETAYQKVSKINLDTECLSWVADAKLDIEQVHWQTWQEVSELAPFGVGNEKPLFLFENVPVAYGRKFGKEQNHLQVNLQQSSGAVVPAIEFSSTRSVPQAGERISLLAHLEKSTFGFKPELRLRIVDLK